MSPVNAPDGELMNITESVRISGFMILCSVVLPPTRVSYLALRSFTPPGNLTELYIPISEMTVTLLIVLAAVNVNMQQ